MMFVQKPVKPALTSSSRAFTNGSAHMLGHLRIEYSQKDQMSSYCWLALSELDVQSHVNTFIGCYN
ncbi:hypothetical protein OUZ56_015913 [Daphnia magna]|uniref:Uncharacterized protein n=1 Tax=Daphnia magna TaxID=35525 RepID=A0ABR0AP39_9CRUS|nr:hypothetical protein OUZ56_015913 [Daphnia magna]